MPEFQYDPSTGQGVEITRGGQSSADEGLSLQQQADLDSQRSFRNTSSYLAQKNTPSAGVGEDVSVAGLEAQLLDLQQQIYADNFNNSIEREAAIAKAEQLAAQAVGATSSQPYADEDKESDLGDPEALRQHVLDQFPNSKETLAQAAEILNDNDRIQALNANLDSGDEATVRATYAFTRELVARPNQFADASSAPDGGFTEDTFNRCVEEVGQEQAEMIRTIGLAVTTGQISTAEALRTASGDPKLLQNMMLLSRMGIIKIAVS